MSEEPICRQEMFAGLEGRRVLVLGRDSGVKEILTGGLREFGRRQGLRLEVSGQPEIRPEDFVILTGAGAAGGKKAQRTGKEKYPWIRPEKEKGEYLGSWARFMELSEDLQAIRVARPAAAVFVSDDSVYGKLFGGQRAVREEDIGYLCHTDEDSQEAQCLRMAEQLCARMAREDGVAVRIARLQCAGADGEAGAFSGGSGKTDGTAAGRQQDAGVLSEGTDPGGASETIEMLMRVLLFGEPGEPYNIPGPRRSFGEAEPASPLSPDRAVKDMTKAESLCRKERLGEDEYKE